MQKDTPTRQLGYAIATILMALLFSYLLSRWIHKPLTNKPVVLYYADNISAAHEEIIQRFNRAHQNRIHVTAINLPFSKFSTNERKELLARTLRSHSDKLDIFAADVIWIPRFAKWSEALDKFFPRAEQQSYLPRVLSFCTIDSSLMAIPLYTDLMHLYYRRDIIASLPNGQVIERQLKEGITWTELRSIKNQIKTGKADEFIFPGKNFEGLMCLYLANLYSLDGHLLEGNKMFPQFDSAIRSGNILVDLVKKDRISPPLVSNLDEYSGFQYAKEHNSTIFVGWPGLNEQRHEELKAAGLDGKFVMAPLPHFNGGKRVSIYGGWNLMLSKNSKHKKEAIEFIRFTSLPENQKLLHNIGGFIPVKNQVYADTTYIEKNPTLKFYLDLSKDGRSRPQLKNYTQISDIMTNYLHEAILGNIDVYHALKMAEKEITSNQITLD